MRDALQSVWRQTGEMPPELRDLPEMPDELRFLFPAFIEMSNGRNNESGAWLPIPNMEIFAWCWLNNIKLRPWEIKIIRTLDGCWLKAMNKGSEGT